MNNSKCSYDSQRRSDVNHGSPLVEDPPLTSEKSGDEEESLEELLS
jgi:hypothetical protein